MGLIETAAGGALGLLLGEHNDARQIDQQKKLQALQIMGNKELTDYNYAKQYDLWLKTNYSAQRKQLEAAGLNPGLLYGMGGGGGSTTGSGGGGGVSGGNAPTGGGEALALTSQAMQLSLLKAQKDNIEADTKQKEAATINTGANTALTKINTDIAKIERDIKDQSSNEAAGIIRTAYEKSLEELQIARNNSKISDATYKQDIERVGAELAGVYLRNNQVKAQTNLTEEQSKEVIQSIQTQIKQLQQGDEHIKIQQVRNELIKTGIWVGAGTQIVGDIISILKTPKKLGETITEVFDDGHGNKTISTRRH